MRHKQGRNDGGQGGSNSPGAESLWGHQITVGSTETSQQCHKHFLHYSAFATEKSQSRTWERQTCFLPLAPSTLVAPLVITIADHTDMAFFLHCSAVLKIFNSKLEIA